MKLPDALRRAELRSFWLVMSGTTVVTIVLVLGRSGWSAAAVGAVACACAAGLIHPGLIRLPYRIWNKSAKIYSRFACAYIMAVAFQLIVRPMSIVVAPVQFAKSNAPSSLWEIRRQVVPAYESQYDSADGCSTQQPWPVGYLSWAWHKKHMPALLLLPLLILLSAVQMEEGSFEASDIYTLF